MRSADIPGRRFEAPPTAAGSNVTSAPAPPADTCGCAALAPGGVKLLLAGPVPVAQGTDSRQPPRPEIHPASSGPAGPTSPEGLPREVSPATPRAAPTSPTPGPAPSPQRLPGPPFPHLSPSRCPLPCSPPYPRPPSRPRRIAGTKCHSTRSAWQKPAVRGGDQASPSPRTPPPGSPLSTPGPLTPPLLLPHPCIPLRVPGSSAMSLTWRSVPRPSALSLHPPASMP
jgi:hypothetical protein